MGVVASFGPSVGSLTLYLLTELDGVLQAEQPSAPEVTGMLGISLKLWFERF